MFNMIKPVPKFSQKARLHFFCPHLLAETADVSRKLQRLASCPSMLPQSCAIPPPREWPVSANAKPSWWIPWQWQWKPLKTNGNHRFFHVCPMRYGEKSMKNPYYFVSDLKLNNRFGWCSIPDDPSTQIGHMVSAK